MTPVQALKRQSLKTLLVLNILSLSYDGNFEGFLTETGHNIYELDAQKAKEPYTHSPKVNLIKYITDKNQSHLIIPNYIDLDLIICNSEGQLQNAKQISHVLHTPIIYVDHIGKFHKKLHEIVNIIVSVVDKNHPNYIDYYIDDWNKLFEKARKLVFRL